MFSALGRVLLTALGAADAVRPLRVDNEDNLLVSGSDTSPMPTRPRKVQVFDEIQWTAADFIVVGEGETEISDGRSVNSVLTESLQVICELAGAGDGLITVYVLPRLGDAAYYADVGEATVVDSFNADGANEIIRPPISLPCRDWKYYKVAILNGDDAEDL
ncbi:unnamed protein product, partial [marine sediment metagenome]